jgi:AcrR family transcriptional regulator
MARRSDHTREELHDMLLAAAMETVRADGIEALTARRLAAAIGYSPGTIYQVFENLDDLVARLKAIVLDMLVARLDAAPRERTPEKHVGRLVEAYVGFAAEEPRLWHALFDAPLPSGATLPDWFGGHILQGLARVEAAVAPLFAEGDRQGPARAARTLWAGLHGIVALARNGTASRAGGLDAAALSRDFAATYLAGIRARAAR